MQGKKQQQSELFQYFNDQLQTDQMAQSKAVTLSHQKDFTKETLSKLKQNKQYDDIQLDISHLNLNNLGQLLTVLNEFNNKDGKALNKIERLVCQHNSFSNIDMLSTLKSLKHIDAEHNLVRTLSLHLESLEYLSLSFNRLTAVPSLSQLPDLKVLLLSNNCITSISNNLLPVRQSLMQIDLSSNQIEFASGGAFQEFLEMLQCMPNLRNIDLTNNPFESNILKAKEHMIKSLCINQKNGNYVPIRINGDDIRQNTALQVQADKNLPALKDLPPFQLQQQQLRRDKLFQQQQAKLNQNEQSLHLNESQQNMNFNQRQFSIQFMNDVLESISNNPLKCMKNLARLNQEVDRALQNPNLFTSLLVSKDPQQQEAITENLESFLTNALMIIESQETARHSLLHIVAKLSVLSQANFGLKCFDILKDLANSSESMAACVLNTIREVITPQLNRGQCLLVPPTIFQGLCSIIQETNIDINQLLSDDILIYMEKWLREIQQNPKSENSAFDYALELVLIAAKDKRLSANMYQQKKMHAMAAQIFQKMVEQKASDLRYVAILQMLENMIRAHQPTGLDFLQKSQTKDSLMKDLEGQFNEFLKEYKRNNNSLYDPKVKQTDQQVKIQYKKFASVIQCYSSIIHFARFSLERLKSNAFINDLLHFSILPKVNPVLLTSICIMIHDLLTSDEIKQSNEMAKWISSELQMLKPLLSNLQDEKYASLCEMGEIYFQGTYFNNQFPVKRQQLSNIVLHALFISIVKVITFFSQNGNRECAIQAVCQQVSNILNNSGREEAMFNCLIVPSDEVKLAVVESLLEVDIEQWDQGEMSHLVNMLSTYKNLGAGKTEEVLSYIFIILTKLSSQQIFISMLAENTIKDCLDILERNMERDLLSHEEESQEKLNLSLACVTFLQAVSKQPQLIVFLKGAYAQDVLKSCLLSECKYLKESYVPVEIERTWIGRNVEYLLNCTSGAGVVFAYHICAYRIVCRIADILNLHANEDYAQIGLSGYDAEYIVRYVSGNFKDRIRKENSIWNMEEEYEQRQSNDQLRNHFNEQHITFSNKYGVTLLLQYLLGHNASQEAGILQKQLEKEFASLKTDFENCLLLQEVNAKYAQYDEEEKRRQQIDEKNKQQASLSNFNPAVENSLIGSGSGSQKLQNALKEMEFLGGNASNELNNHMADGTAKLQDRNYLSPEKESLPQDSKFKKSKKLKSWPKQIKESEANDDIFDDLNLIIQPDENSDQSNEYQKEVMINKRGLLLSAFLRCILGAIVYAPEKKSRETAIKQIKDRVISTSITKLCSSTGWMRANIGSKYLKIMYYGLVMPAHQHALEEKSTIYFYELISKAIYELLGIIRKRIMEEEKKPLSTEEKTLMYQIVSCTSVICKQLPNFLWGGGFGNLNTNSMNTTTSNSNHNDGYKVMSPQYRCNEFLLSALFPSDQIKIILDISMSEMKYSSQLTKIPIQDQLDLQVRDKMRVLIIKIVGFYLSQCRQNRYDILEYFNQNEYFERKTIRQTFLQEVVAEMKKANYQNKLREYLISNIDAFDDRIIDITWCLFVEEMSDNWKYQLMIFTNKQILFMVLPKQPCGICTAENFCPEGPTLAFSVEYSAINYVMQMESEQRLALSVSKDASNSKSSQQQSGFLQSVFGWTASSTSSQSQLQQSASQNKRQKNENQQYNFILFFPQKTFIKEALGIFQSFNNIKFIQDSLITIKAVQNWIDQVKEKADVHVKVWATVNPSKDLLEKLKDIRDISELGKVYLSKSLVIMASNQLIILQESIANWSFVKPQQQSQSLKADQQSDSERDKDDDNSSINSTHHTHSNKNSNLSNKPQFQSSSNAMMQKQLQAQVEFIFARGKEWHYDLSQLKNIEFSQGPIATIMLKFNSQPSIEILFYCDASREQFRMALLKILPTQQWQVSS